MEREGVVVDGDLPGETRGGTTDTLVWIFIAIGIDRSIDLAVDRVKARWPEIKIRIRERHDDLGARQRPGDNGPSD